MKTTVRLDTTRVLDETILHEKYNVIHLVDRVKLVQHSCSKIYRQLHYYKKATWYHQSQDSTTSLDIFSKPFLSSSSKPRTARQSRSSTPIHRPSNTRGHTISLFVSPSQAMWPGYESTSGTSIVFLWMKALAQTPRAFPGVTLINWQAGFPQNGPSRRFSSSFAGSSLLTEDNEGVGNSDESI